MSKRTVQSKVTYLEIRHPPDQPAEPPDVSIRIEQAKSPSVEFYRELYRSVGSELNWTDRILMLDEDLARIIQDNNVDVFVLQIGGETAGYVEFDRRVKNEVEIVYFGLFPQFIGRGLGKFFLQWTLQQAWRHKPERVWLHTCDLDHQAALPNYLSAGFKVYKEEIVDQVVAN